MAVPEKDKQVLRDLAKQIAEIASLPVQKQKAEMWTRHNRLERVRPMVLTFPEGGWDELLDESVIQTTDEFCRGLEWNLRAKLYLWEHMPGDHVVDDVIHSPIHIHDSGWGVTANPIYTDDKAGAARYEPVVRTEEDLDLIKTPRIDVDWEATKRHQEKLADIFGGILGIKPRGCSGFWFSPMDDFITWRGIGQTFIDMMDRPEWVHRAMNRLLTGALARLDQLEQQGLLSPNWDNSYIGSGALGFSDQLPQPDFDGKRVRSNDMWGHATTQIFSEVSPAMHEEFALQYEKQFLSRFGLNCYGCCEPLDKKVDLITRNLPNLRRISMSPWVDVERGAAALGKKYIFNCKPNPALLAGETWNPDYVRSYLRDVLEKTKGCVVELVMKDTHTCRNEPHRFWEYSRIALELAEEYAG